MTNITKQTRSPGFWLSVLIALLTLALLVPSHSLLLKNIADYSPLIVLAQFLLGLLCFMLNYQRVMIVSFGCCALLCLKLEEASTTGPVMEEKERAQEVQIAHFNLNGREVSGLIRGFTASGADLISLQEINHAQEKALADSMHLIGYPYQQLVKIELQQISIGLFSRYPVDFIRTIRLHNAVFVVGKVRMPPLDDQPSFHFISSYIEPATDQASYYELINNVEALALQSGHIHAPLLIFGNFNLPSWSDDLSRFRKVSGLKRSGNGTRPSDTRIAPPLFDTQLDHLFYSKQFKCISFERITGPDGFPSGITGSFELDPKDAPINVRRTSQKF